MVCNRTNVRSGAQAGIQTVEVLIYKQSYLIPLWGEGRGEKGREGRMDLREIKASEGTESFTHLPPRDHFFSTEVAVWKEGSNLTQHSDECEAEECMQSLAWPHIARFMFIPQKYICLRAIFALCVCVFSFLFSAAGFH